MNLAVIGLSHKTASIEVREKLSIPKAKIKQVIDSLCNCPNICEIAILSTCNRMEIYVSFLSEEHAFQEVIEFLSKYSQLSVQTLNQYLFILVQQNAVIHLMKVASGLDSVVLGEGQILCQVKCAYQLSLEFNGIGQVLNQLFKQAITAAKTVRSETSICKGAVSVSAAAVQLAKEKTQDLSACRIAIVGAGKMARLLVKHLLSKGAKQVSIINRSIEQAEELASEFNKVWVQCYPLAEITSVIANSDLVFTSTSSTEPLLNKANLEACLHSKQTLMLIDISVPRNVDANVDELNHVYVFNVDHLKDVVAQNHESRRQAAIEAQQLVEQELKKFMSWFESLETVSTISCLWKKVEAIRQQELEKALSGQKGEPLKEHKQAIDYLTRGIIKKILHEPTLQLRTEQDIELQRLTLQSLKILFNLDINTKLLLN